MPNLSKIVLALPIFLTPRCEEHSPASRIGMVHMVTTVTNSYDDLDTKHLIKGFASHRRVNFKLEILLFLMNFLKLVYLCSQFANLVVQFIYNLIFIRNSDIQNYVTLSCLIVLHYIICMFKTNTIVLKYNRFITLYKI